MNPDWFRRLLAQGGGNYSEHGRRASSVLSVPSQKSSAPQKKKSQSKTAESNVFATDWLANSDGYNFMQTQLFIDS